MKESSTASCYQTLSAEFYDLSKPKPFKEELDFYKSRLGGQQEWKILDAMCGTGRLLIPLLKNGLNIHGLDISQTMLDRCQAASDVINLKPVLYLGSIDSINLPHKYHIILVSGASFQLIYPRERAINALKNIRSHLVKGGIVFLDLFIPWELLQEEKMEEQMIREVSDRQGNKITLKTKSIANRFEQYFVSKNIYKKYSHETLVGYEEEEMPVLWYYYYEITKLLEEAGFDNIKFHEKAFGLNPEVSIYEAEAS